MTQHDQDKYVVLCEVIKYAYYQTHDTNLKEIIVDTMSRCDEKLFLDDIHFNYTGTSYSTALQLGYEYERFFSLNSLRFVYGNDLPRRIIDKSYFPHKILVDNIWLDTNHKVSEYFKVMFHKQLREIDDFEYGFTKNGIIDILFALCKHITDHYEEEKFTQNVLWVTNICNPQQQHVVENAFSRFLKYIPFIGINTAFLILSKSSNKVVPM